jgi:hypothetical protein
MSGDIQVQRLVEARVFIVKGNMNDIVLRFTGDVEAHHFTISSADFLGLVDRFVKDAALLTRPVGQDRPQ